MDCSYSNPSHIVSPLIDYNIRLNGLPASTLKPFKISSTLSSHCDPMKTEVSSWYFSVQNDLLSNSEEKPDPYYGPQGFTQSPLCIAVTSLTPSSGLLPFAHSASATLTSLLYFKHTSLALASRALFFFSLWIICLVYALFSQFLFRHHLLNETIPGKLLKMDCSPLCPPLSFFPALFFLCIFYGHLLRFTFYLLSMSSHLNESSTWQWL